jgi:hypothetical protein
MNAIKCMDATKKGGALLDDNELSLLEEGE